MTTVRLLYASTGQLAGYEVSGHAGAGTQGNDLVCAALSLLATACANALETVAGQEPQVTQRDGYLRVALEQRQLNPDAQAVLRTFRQGAQDLEQAHPEHVRLLTQAP